MFLEKNLEKKWLIKSENKILGPYSFDQIIDLLRKKQISIIDEVRDPETRWLYVRENNEFKNIVEEIRKEIDSRQESTKTYQSVNTSTSAFTMPSFEDLAQKTRTDISAPIPTESNIETQEVEVVRETRTKAAEPALQKIEKAKIYGVVSDSAVQTKISDYSKKLKIGVALLAFIVASSYLTYLFYQKRNFLKKEEELVLQVKRLKYLGLTDKATEVFASLPAVTQQSLMPSLLDIFPVMQKNNLIDIEDIKTMKTNSSTLTLEQRANIELILYWAAAKQLNFGQAQDYISTALKLQPNFPLAQENDAWLTLKRSKSKEAYAQFKKLSTENGKNGRYLYGCISAFWSMPVVERGAYAADLLKDLDRYTITSFDMQKELLLAQIYIARELGDVEIYKISLEQFFNTPTQLSNQFIKPSLLLPDTYTWKGLEGIKNSVFEKLSGDDAILFQLHDYLEQGQLNAASDYLNSNLSKVSDAKVKSQLNLLLYNAQNRSKDVIALWRSNTLEPKSKINNFLVAYNQIEHDPKVNIADYLREIEKKEKTSDLKDYTFYKEWLMLKQKMAASAPAEVKDYLKDHFVTSESFLPAIDARNLVN